MSVEKKNIILVDDDPTNLTIGSNTLGNDYDVITLNSGERLLKLLEKKIPDMILLDVDMPDMNGYETIVKIKSNKNLEHIPIIFLTAKSDTDSELEGLSLGATDYITKPFSPPLLLKRINMHLLVESQKDELIAQKQELLTFNDQLQEMVDRKTKTVVELQNAILRTMAELVECRDNITGGHIERTQGYLRILINALCKSSLYSNEISSWDLELVLQSAQLHDVGKIAIDDNILRKPGGLTDEEYNKIKVHTVFGEEIIERIKKNTSEHTFLEHARIFASTHHERWDGSGYPHGLKGEGIPLQGRLMAVADVYDALVSERPYKKPLSHEYAVEMIKYNRGTHFDPVLVDLFLDVKDEIKEFASRPVISTGP